MIRGIHHVAISTPDIDRLLGFYRDLLGMQEVMRFDWDQGSEDIDQALGLKHSAARQVMIKAENLCIELFEFKNPTPSTMNPNRPVCDHGHTHICFDVQDIFSVYNKMVAAGVRFHAPPKDYGHLKFTYGRDPDGNVFELQELTTANDPTRVL